MTRLEREALVAEIADEMQQHGSWTGETHLQKASYVLQEVYKLPSGFTFTLYKHGPFSFDLRDELTSMRVDGMVEQRPMPPYGPMLATTDMSRALRRRYADVIARYRDSIVRVATRLGPMDVAQLEQIATAVYVLVEEAELSDEAATQRLRDIKPHIPSEAAAWAVAEARAIRIDADQQQGV